jgi:hypothetical protein
MSYTSARSRIRAAAARSWDAIKQSPCSRCGAKAGASCKTSGGWKTVPHLERRAAAQSAGLWNPEGMTTRVRRTNIRGHALRSEGAAHIPGKPEEEQSAWIRCRGHIGYGVCECGDASPCLWSAAARKRWHAEHKATIRDQEG